MLIYVYRYIILTHYNSQVTMDDYNLGDMVKITIVIV